MPSIHDMLGEIKENENPETEVDNVPISHENKRKNERTVGN